MPCRQIPTPSNFTYTNMYITFRKISIMSCVMNKNASQRMRQRLHVPCYCCVLNTSHRIGAS